MNLDQATLERYRFKLRYKVAFHLGSSCPDLEDVVQETMLRFVSALRSEKVRSPESVAAFLSGICNNVIHEYKRQVQRDSAQDSADPVPLTTPGEAGAAAAELRQVIGLVMLQLSPKEQDILRAFYLEERTKPEICRSMGFTDIQFRVALCRAKEKFREIYRQSLKQNAAKQH